MDYLQGENPNRATTALMRCFLLEGVAFVEFGRPPEAPAGALRAAAHGGGGRGGRYVIARCILPRDNTSNMSSPDLAILAAAINHDDSYNIGALIARRLSTNKVKGTIYGGIIASIMLTTVMLPPGEDDLELEFIRLDLAAMKSHHFVTYDSTLENLQYRLLFGFDLDNPRFVRLPAPVLFNPVARDG